MKIYTRTGDKGQTSLYGGKRVWKNELHLEAYGTIDELNSSIGIVLSENKDKKIDKILKEIQNDLFFIGSQLAGYQNSKQLTVNPSASLRASSKQLEKWTDELEKELPELKNFILPGGTKTASLLHLSRSICRRAERKVVELSQKENVNQEIMIYLNRLSDLLFEMARSINRQAKITEIIWKI